MHGGNIWNKLPLDIFPPKTKLLLYKTYVRPVLEYATCVFSSHLTAGQEQMLEDVQRQALLACLNAYRHTSHTKLL